MKYFILWLTCFASFSSNGIVIRHDVADKKYHATVDDFPPLATFYVDGAHGSLIAPKWVITAAHATFCITPNSFVRINEKNRRIKNLYIHPDYTSGKSHDLALVELYEPIMDVFPAEIYQENNEENMKVWFVGIGGTGNGLTGETIDNAQNNGLLRKAQNTIVTAQGPLIKFVFNRGEAALPLEGVSGGGDSGGPAFIKDLKGFKLLGISSRPEGAFEKFGVYDIKEVYTRVSFFKPWVTKVIESSQRDREGISNQKLNKLPTGLSEDILPEVCHDIAVR
jgi:hypothetical protein